MNILRRLPLNRLLLVVAAVIVLGISATALASALDTGPVPPAKPLAEAVHDAIAAPAVEGVSANIQLTNHLLEGANLATGGGGTAGEVASNPLLAGASGRLWIAKDGKVRVELQTEKGDTEIIYDGHTVTLYDAATNTLYHYTPAPHEGSGGTTPTQASTPPTVAKIEEAIAHLQRHANVSGATPTDVAGHAAYTVRVSPKESGSLLGGAELSFDAVTGAPLRAAIYSSTNSAPVIELAATSVSYGPVSESVFAFTAPPNAKIEEISSSSFAGRHRGLAENGSGSGAAKPKLTGHGSGLSTIGVVEATSSTTKGSSNPLEGLPQVNINGINASELSTELGTILSFERGGVRYVVGGSVAPSAVEALARGL